MGMGGNLELFYKDSQIILVGFIAFFIIFGIVFIFKKRKSVKNEDRLKENMVQLEVLDKYNRTQLINLDRKDIPLEYVADVEHTISLADYGAKFGLGGRCFAIKYGGKYVCRRRPSRNGIRLSPCTGLRRCHLRRPCQLYCRLLRYGLYHRGS